MTAAKKATATIRSALDTEFGAVLAPMVSGVHGAIAAVLSDDDGDPIDYAHVPGRISPLDVALVGAQFGLPLLRLHHTAESRRLREPALVLEARRNALLAGIVAGEYVLAFMLARPANLAQAMSAFASGRAQLDELLR